MAGTNTVIISTCKSHSGAYDSTSTYLGLSISTIRNNISIIFLPWYSHLCLLFPHSCYLFPSLYLNYLIFVPCALQLLLRWGFRVVIVQLRSALFFFSLRDLCCDYASLKTDFLIWLTWTQPSGEAVNSDAGVAAAAAFKEQTAHGQRPFSLRELHSFCVASRQRASRFVNNVTSFFRAQARVRLIAENTELLPVRGKGVNAPCHNQGRLLPLCLNLQFSSIICFK